jgi:hypothetical protein
MFIMYISGGIPWQSEGLITVGSEKIITHTLHFHAEIGVSLFVMKIMKFEDKLCIIVAQSKIKGLVIYSHHLFQFYSQRYTDN